VAHANTSTIARVLGVRPGYESVLRLSTGRGRFVAAIDEDTVHPICVLGHALAAALFGFRDPIGEDVRIDQRYYRVVGVLAPRNADPSATAAIAWRDLDAAVMVPMPALTGRTIAGSPDLPVDEIWVQAADGAQVEEIGRAVDHALDRMHGRRDSISSCRASCSPSAIVLSRPSASSSAASRRLRCWSAASAS
jgi:putative ABC transport system permease protein